MATAHGFIILLCVAFTPSNSIFQAAWLIRMVQDSFTHRAGTWEGKADA